MVYSCIVLLAVAVICFTVSVIFLNVRLSRHLSETKFSVSDLRRVNAMQHDLPKYIAGSNFADFCREVYGE